ncbi:MAG: hypothetical protein AAF184_24260 [Pseudomonadota bacterium]
MSDMQTNRFLLELEKTRRDINREIMNPEVQPLGIEHLEPAITLAAKARLDYLKELLEIAEGADGQPSGEQIAALASKREAYEELAAATTALETAIDRGYLDVTVGE